MPHSNLEESRPSNEGRAFPVKCFRNSYATPQHHHNRIGTVGGDKTRALRFVTGMGGIGILLYLLFRMSRTLQSWVKVLY